MYRRRRILALSALAVFLLGAWAVARHAIWPDRHGASTHHFDVHSRAVGRKLGVSVVVPAGASNGRPLLVWLHGRRGNEDSELRNGAMYSALAAAAGRAPVIAFPYGGDHSYWHNRRGGAWDRYVVREVIPAVTRRFHTDPKRVAIGGISMGGYGALEIARLHPRRFCAAGGHSPAIWQTGGETAPGAFDDGQDFAHHDLVGTARGRPRSWDATRLWLDAGASDPFQPGDRAFVQAMRRGGAAISAHLGWHGGHEHSYWQRHWPAYVAFYAHALAHCHGVRP